MISILMPIYNGHEFMRESIPSILQQTYKNWELIIGINGHEKNSVIYKDAKKWEIVDERIKVYDLYTIKGKSNALNEMLKYCKYQWISLLDVDDIWSPYKLAYQFPYMPSYDVIGTKCQYFGDSKAIPRIPSGDLKNYDFLKCNPIINSSCLLKKNLCKWESTLDGVEDYDLWLKLWKEGNCFYNVDKILVLHRIYQESAFNSNNNQFKKINNLVSKY